MDASAKRSELRIGSVGSTPILRAPVPERVRLLQRVADAALDHLFVADHVSFHDGTGMDGLVNAATLLASHPRLRVVVGVYLLALRHPTAAARQIASLCESAPGRLELGVGVGGEDRREIESCGVDPRTRGRRTDEALAVLRGLLSGEPLEHRGEFFTLDAVRIRPPPDPPVPIVVGGRSGAAIRRAGRLGDGWLSAWVSPERFARARDEIAEIAHAAGRGEVAWRHGLQVWCAPGDDAGVARERLAAAMQGLYRVPFERFARYSPVGPPDKIAAFLLPYAEAGCSTFNVMAVCSSEEASVDAVGEIARCLREARGVDA